MRETAAAIKIQARVRGWVKRVQYRRLLYIVTQLQAHARGGWARQRFQHMRRVRAVSFPCFFEEFQYSSYIG